MIKIKIQKIISKIILIFKNYHPSKWEALSFLIIPIFIGILCSLDLDNDTWFILNYGRYIINHGFPTIDPFTIHEGLNLVIQQWSTDIIFYTAYEHLGKIGLYLIVNLVNIYIIFITYKLLMLVTDNKRNLSVILTIIIVSLFDLWFLTSRPQIFSSSILITELYVLEKYTKTKSNKILYLLPILSLLMINFHASMWLILFCFWLPFFINTFKFRIGKLTSEGLKKKDLIISFIFMIIVGFINPYGLKSMTYLFTSYNIPYIYNFVCEMKTPSINSILGIFIYLCIFSIYIIYILLLKKQIKIYHFLLLIGTTFLAVSQNRGILFFIIASIYPLGYYFKDNFYIIKEPKNNKKMKVLFLLTLTILGIFPFMIMLANNNIKFIASAKKGIDYLVETVNTDEIRLYCSYEQCNYAEYLGIKTYSDSRAEIFLKANNKKEDILEELYKLSRYELDANKFLEKYNFTHLLVRNKEPLYKELINNSDYEIIYKEEIKDKEKSNNIQEESDKYLYFIFKKI